MVWDSSSKFEEKWMRTSFEIKDAAPLSWDENEIYLGLIAFNKNEEKTLAIIWNLDEGKQHCCHLVSEEARLFSAGNKLLIKDEGYLKDSITGLIVNFWHDHPNADVLDPSTLSIATHSQLMIDICPLKGRYMLPRVHFQNKSYHRAVQDRIVGGSTNILALKETLFFKDPESGKSIFSQVGFNAKYQSELQKAIEAQSEMNDEIVE